MKIPLARYWSLLAVYIRGQKGLFWLLALVLIASIGFKILIPQITRLFVDGAKAGETLESLFLLGVLFLGTAIAGQLLTIGATWLGEIVAWNATNKLRTDLAEHCLDLDMAFHKGKTPGEMIERLDEDVTLLARFFSQLVVMIGGNLLLVIGIVIMFFLEDLRLGITFLLFTAASLYLLNQLREIAIPHEVERRRVIAELFGFLEERLAGTEDIRANGAVAYVLNGLFRIQSDLLVAWRTVQLRYWALGVVTRSVSTVGYVIAFVFGFWLYNKNAIGLGTAFLIVHYMNVLSRPMRELAMQVEQLQGVGASIDRIAELVDERSELVYGDVALVETGGVKLAFSHVDFGYEAEPTLRDISLELGQGEVLGLLGRTGSGKTTLARLVTRLYDVTSGEITLDGHDLRTLSKDSLGSTVAMVTQDVQLYQASVRDNVTFFNRSIPDDVIQDVLSQVELRDWYNRLPKGLDTMLETGGRSMSAGEAQLLAFARVFLKDPRLVILDEASSRLDPLTERRIERAIDRLLVGRSAVIIAHRLATVQRADKILILSEGRVREYGHRTTLLDDPDSEFARLMATGLTGVLA
ncbi:MAG: ABC transporter ATP-binding protein [Pseudomonadales bacterium]|nr:ABC transporter ATP-binding protein [Pseudomonadales bacterium]